MPVLIEVVQFHRAVPLRFSSGRRPCRFDGSLPWFGPKARKFYSECPSGRGFSGGKRPSQVVVGLAGLGSVVRLEGMVLSGTDSNQQFAKFAEDWNKPACVYFFVASLAIPAEALVNSSRLGLLAASTMAAALTL